MTVVQGCVRALLRLDIVRTSGFPVWNPAFSLATAGPPLVCSHDEDYQHWTAVGFAYRERTKGRPEPNVADALSRRRHRSRFAASR